MRQTLDHNPVVENDGGTFEAPLRQEQAAKAPAGLSKPMRAMRRFVLAAVVATAPIVSCGEADTGSDTQSALKSQTVETGQNSRKLDLYTDGSDFYVQGNYPQDFRVKVSADGQEIYNDVVTKGHFQLRKSLGKPDVKRVDIAAFHVDENQNEAAPIEISGQPGTDGMYGSSYAVNTDRM